MEASVGEVMVDKQTTCEFMTKAIDGSQFKAIWYSGSGVAGMPVGDLVSIAVQAFADSPRWQVGRGKLESWLREFVAAPENGVVLIVDPDKGCSRAFAMVTLHNHGVSTADVSGPAACIVDRMRFLARAGIVVRFLRRRFRNSIESRRLDVRFEKSSADRRFLYVSELAVSPLFRNRGLGGALVEACSRYAALLECDSLRLAVEAGNRPARKLYERAGFVYVGRGGHSLAMRRGLR